MRVEIKGDGDGIKGAVSEVVWYLDATSVGHLINIAKLSEITLEQLESNWLNYGRNHQVANGTYKREIPETVWHVDVDDLQQLSKIMDNEDIVLYFENGTAYISEL